MGLMSLPEEQRSILLELARASIMEGLRIGRPLKVLLSDYTPDLREIRASFVTLERQQILRGCIGRLEAVRPLVEDIAENAFAAAFRDRRFPPLTQAELSDLQLHISILSPAEALQFNSEAALIGQLRPNIDGLILDYAGQRATFLPSVWESLPEPREFVRHLKQKAGLGAGFWANGIQAYRYMTESFGD